MTVELWIPCRAPNLNDLIRASERHHHAYDKLKKQWANLVMLTVFAHPSPQVLLGRRCSVHFELVEQNTRRDPDNIASGTAKLVLDGLVKAGVLEGDGWKHIAGLSFSWRVGSPVGVRVVLTETEAA